MSKDRKVESQIDAARKQYFKSLKEYKKLTESENVEAGRPGRYSVVMSLEAFEGAVWDVLVKVNLNKQLPVSVCGSLNRA